jgi:hypothetical protein
MVAARVHVMQSRPAWQCHTLMTVKRFQSCQCLLSTTVAQQWSVHDLPSAVVRTSPNTVVRVPSALSPLGLVLDAKQPQPGGHQRSSTADCLASQTLVSEPLYLPGTLIHISCLLHAGGRRQSLVATALRRGSLVGVPLGARRGSVLLDGPNAVPAVQVSFTLGSPGLPVLPAWRFNGAAGIWCA